jgi:methylated-DNA-[protein]-cysteine S-methyltransferase
MDILRSIASDTPDGEFHIIVDSDDVARASGFGGLANLQKRLPAEFHNISLESVTNHPYESLVAAYYDGDTSALDKIPRHQEGSDFQEKVWQAISAIPYGKTMSYKELADASGNPAAIRAAGTICGLNKLILLVPCHRILKSDGGVGSYLYGPKIKTSLLRREHAI